MFSSKREVEKKEERKVTITVDRLIKMFCEINNLFINVRPSIMRPEATCEKMIQARQWSIKKGLADILNEAYGKPVLNGEYHPFEIKEGDVKKILENAKHFL